MFVVFLGLFGLLLGAAHWYLYRRTCRVFGLRSRKARIGLAGALAFLAIGFPLARGLLHWSYGPLSSGLYLLSTIWMGLGFYLFLFVSLAHLVTGLAGLVRIQPRLERWTRLPLARATFLLALFASLGLTIFGLYQARCGAVWTRIEVPVRGLPAELDGLRIAQITDVHVGVVIAAARLQEIVDQVNQRGVDLVVITGDLVDEDAERFDAVKEPLARLTPRLGTWAVTGNHEYFSDAERAVESARQAGIRFLRNECVEVEGLWLCGIDDPTAERFGSTPPPFEAVLGQVPATRPLVFLYHQPRGFERAVELGVDVMLSGHTHGGQLWPFGWLSGLAYPRQAGLFEHQGGHLYVSRGIGTWGPPIRVGSPPELVEIVLRTAAD
jgi:hypothetical protein